MFVELRNKLAVFDSFFKPFSRGGALLLSERQPRIYLALTLLLALAAYLFLFLFPASVLILPVTLYHSIQSASTAENWFYVGIQVPFLLIGGAVTITLFRLRFSLPSGLELSKATCPRLFELLEELGDIFDEPRIDRVVLRDRFDIRIVKTPVNGFALSSSRTLVIGLPVLLTMTPLDVHVLLARRVGLLSGKSNRIKSWLFYLRDMWPMYVASCGVQEGLLFRPLCAFFNWYAPLYRSFSVGAARYSELEADRYALQAINDQDTARGITYQVLMEVYLRRRYWPDVLQTVKQSRKQETRPHADMAKAFTAGLSDEDTQLALRWAKKEGRNRGSVMPSLEERLDNIGYLEASLTQSMPVTAAQFYLGNACDKCIEIIDKRTLKKLRSKVIHEMSSKL